MFTRRRAISALVLLLALAFGWSAWLALQTARDLRAAETSVNQIRAAVTTGDRSAREAAVADLQQAARSAKSHTDGLWWSALTFTPLVGDDAAGIRALSASLDLVATKAVAPLSNIVDDLDGLVDRGRIDVEKVAAMQPKVADAENAFGRAAELVTSRDSAGFAGAFRTRYEDYVGIVSSFKRDLGSAETAIAVLPTMLGAEGDRQYLLIFENNAEIRATGGLPGSWAQMSASDGRLELERQGAATDFDPYVEPTGDITPEEEALFGKEMGRFFQDPNFTPDFPRAAEVFNAFWEAKYPAEPLDGVISLDVVGLSYLLNGLGPVQSGGLTLTADNVVDQLLSQVYVEPDPAKQDEIFRNAARTIFEATISGPDDPAALVEGISKAAREGRLHVASFISSEATTLSGTTVLGELSADDGDTPHVDIALNDATASKMSYYLRYTSRVTAQSCSDGVQQLDANLMISQSITLSDAKNLPASVTGAVGFNSVEPGTQLVKVHVFAPYQGAVNDIKIDGKSVAVPEVVMIKGRPAITLAILVDSSDDVLVTLRMETGPGQTAGGIVNETPSIVPGRNVSIFASAC